MQANGAKKLPDSLLSLALEGNMFSKKKFIFNGKARRKISPSPSPPELVPGEVLSLISGTAEMVDFTRFDFIGIEEFLSILMEKSDKSDTLLWSASCVLSSQLKSSRALLSLRSYLSSYDQTITPLDRLIDTAYFILSAENVYILQLDSNGTDLVVTHTHTDGAIGLRAPVSDVLSGTDKALNVTSPTRNHPFVSLLDSRTSSITRNFISIPIIIDAAVRGGIFVTNKISSREEIDDMIQPGQRGGDWHDTGAAFGSLDEVLLGFIAGNAGLVIKNTMSPGRMFKPKCTSLSLTSKRPRAIDIESPLQLLVDKACDELDADLVSVLAYNDVTKCLESTVSNDRTDLSIPIDTGIAGSTFRMGRVMNVQETALDERHNRDLDMQVGYETQSLLCAPIMNSSGRPVGVIQALNKRSMSHFSRHDEVLIGGLCSQAFCLLHNVDFLSEYAINDNASLVAKLLSAVISSPSITCMVEIVRRLIMDIVICDYVNIYTFVSDSTGEHLICHDTSHEFSDKKSTPERIPFADIPIEILDALKSGEVTEMSVPGKSSKKNFLESFLPGIMARHALVYPLLGNNLAHAGGEPYTGRNHTDENGKIWQCSSVLVVIRNSQSWQPFLEASRDMLVLTVAVLGAAMEHVISRQLRDSAIASLESKFLLANKILGILPEYIVLLGAGGQVITWNRDLSSLLGLEEEVVDAMTINRDMTEELWVRSRTRIEGTGICQGQHFSRWFKRSNCVELAVDIANATDESRIVENRKNICKRSIFTSSEYPTGTPIEYQLLFDEKDDSISNGETNNVVLVIRMRHDTDMLKTSTESADNAPTDAKKLIGEATSLIESVGVNYAVASNVQIELDIAADHLQHLTESLHSTSFSASLKNNKCIQRVGGLVNIDVALPENLFTWDFNVLEIDDKAVLVNVLGKIFECLQLLDGLGICPVMLASYLREISVKYHDNPFHNLQHATCVTQFAYMLINATDAVKYLSPQQLFGVVLSAVVHDVDHPGNTNMFEINSQSYLSLLYNDQSVLENHHCSTAFQLMRKPSSNILSGLTKAMATEMRRTIVSCVMATDMSVHFQLVDETKKIVAGGDYSFSEVQDQLFLCKLLVHSADLSNPVRPFHITQAWARRISAEFNLQVTMEQELNMPVLNFMMTPDDKALCKNETGFASFVVAPMWRSLSGLFPGLTPLVQQLDSNLLHWKSMLEKIMRDEESERNVQ